MNKNLLILALAFLVLSSCEGTENQQIENAESEDLEEHSRDIYKGDEVSFEYPADWTIQELSDTEQLGRFLEGTASQENGPGFSIYSDFNGGFECSTGIGSEAFTLRNEETVNGEILNPGGNPECNPTGKDLGERMVLVHLPSNLLMLYRFNELESPDGLNLLEEILLTFQISETFQNEISINTQEAQLIFESINQCAEYRTKAEDIGEMFTKMAGYIDVVEKVFYSERTNSCLAIVEATMPSQEPSEYSTRFELIDLSSERDFGEALIQVYGCIPSNDCGSNKTPSEMSVEFYFEVENYR